MANSLRNSQAAPPIPALVDVSSGRHRRNRPKDLVLSQESERSYVAEPKVVLPHPPLLSGGWDRGFDRDDTEPPDRSLAAALTLSLLGGPLGLCYTSVVGGIVCLALMGTGLIVIGLAAVPVVWLLSLVWAVCGMRRARSPGYRH
jgi:hypothetical protein